MKRTLCTVVSASVILASCASSPDKISASYVSPIQYSGLTCLQLRQEMMRVSRKVQEVAGIQQSEATKDTVALTAGLILFWPALFFMMGTDKKDEIARLKGEYEAIETASIRNDCAFLEEVEAERARAEAEAEAERKALEEALPEAHPIP